MENISTISIQYWNTGSMEKPWYFWYLASKAIYLCGVWSFWPTHDFWHSNIAAFRRVKAQLWAPRRTAAPRPGPKPKHHGIPSVYHHFPMEHCYDMGVNYGTLMYIVEWILRSIIGHTHIIPYIIHLYIFVCFWCDSHAFVFYQELWSTDLCNVCYFTGPWMLQCASMRPILQQCLQMRLSREWPLVESDSCFQELKKTYFQSSFNFRYQHVTS